MIKMNLPKPKNLNDAIDAFIKFYNDCKRGKKPVWDFDDLTDQTMTLSIKERLSDENLKFQKDLNGYGFFNQFVTSVFMLGMEHGKRCYEHHDLENQINQYLIENNLLNPEITGVKTDSNKSFECYKCYMFGNRECCLAIYYGDGRYWVNFSASEGKKPYTHGVPFHFSFETRKEADSFRDRLANWFGFPRSLIFSVDF